jgi:hypothetical protein
MTDTISQDLLEKAKKIGATPYRIFPGEISHLMVPCKVMTRNRSIVEMSLVCFQNIAPLESWQKHVRATSEIIDIMPSEYTLPYRIRLATTKAREVRMSYSPTAIKANLWQRFNLSGTTNFFDYRDIKGKDISKSWFFSINSLTFSDNTDKITFFIAELTDEIMSKLAPH